MMPDQMQKWLRQHSKDFFAAGFHAMVKPMLVEDTSRNKCFFFQV
jgi:hypothetical protein